MILLFSTLYHPPPPPPPPDPVTLVNKTMLVSRIKTLAPIGKHSYAWWLEFFETVLKNNWDA